MKTIKRNKNRILLDKSIHYFDPIVQRITHTDPNLIQNAFKSLIDLNDKKSESGENTKVVINAFLSKYSESMDAAKLYYSCVAPLQILLSTYLSKGKTDLFTPKEISFDFDSTAHSARDIYKLIIQLPEYVVLKELQRICIENDTDAILDAYKSRNEEDFVKSFALIKNKQSVKDELIAISKTIDMSNNCIRLSEQEINNDNLCDNIDFLLFSAQDVSNTIQPLDHIRKAPSFQNMFSEDGLPEINLQNVIKEYKRILLLYLDNVQKFDSITEEYANQIIQNPDYYDTTKALLDECQKLKDKNGEKNAIRIIPLPFTSSISVENDKRILFLTELYNTLVNNRYVDSNRCEDFVFLMGGEISCPENLTPINWIKQKNQLQAFCSAYLGKESNIEWSTLNSYFTWKGGLPNLSNSCGVIPINYKNTFLNYFKECKKKVSD